MTGITTINLGGTTHVLSFKNNFVLLLGITMDIDPANAHEKIAEYCAAGQVIRALTIITYCAIVAHHERQYNYNHGITIQQVSEWCSDAPEDEFTSVWRAFADIMGVPEASEKQIAEYEAKLKKKAISQKVAKSSKSPGKVSSSTL